jgi:hypothetical protein
MGRFKSQPEFLYHLILWAVLSSCDGLRVSFDEIPSQTISLSYESANGMDGNLGVSLSVVPSTLTTTGDAIASCTSSPALPSWASLDSSTCVISGTPNATLPPTTYTITASNSTGSGSAQVALTVCPIGYSSVPSSTNFGVSAFCVARFEMKCSGVNCPTGTPGAGAIAISQANNTPWVNISFTNAQLACDNLNSLWGVSNKFDLISNPEWMTIASEIEKTPSNWLGQIVGTNLIPRGHSDGNPNAALEVTNNLDPYDGTGNSSSSGMDQRRIFQLSNNEYIWDFAGNVSEWVDWSYGGALDLGPITCPLSWVEFFDVSCSETIPGQEYQPLNPAGVSENYGSSYGLGLFRGGSGGAATRGGRWANGSFSGIYTNSLQNSSTTATIHLGFRCVFRH